MKLSDIGVGGGIVVASLILVVGAIVYRELDRARDIEMMNQAMRNIADISTSASPSPSAAYQPSFDPRLTAEARQARMRQIRQSQPRRLADNQRCVGGVVIVVNGHSYTQTGERCSGPYVLP